MKGFQQDKIQHVLLDGGQAAVSLRQGVLAPQLVGNHSYQPPKGNFVVCKGFSQSVASLYLISSFPNYYEYKDFFANCQ